MMAFTGLAACLGLVGAIGALERIGRDRARRAIPVRVHVNGTRGKSTVTRMIWSALVDAGVPAAAKTTGTRPRLLLPDRREEAIARHAPPAIREQLWLLRRARRAGARAVVVECMAVDPELQWVTEHLMIGATIGVVTNVRIDHLEAMGQTRGAIAHALANTIPRGGVLVLGDVPFARLFERRALPLGTRVVVAGRPEAGDGVEASSAERQNEAIALAVCRELGLDDETALRGIRRAPADPGAASSGVFGAGPCRVAWLDASAANDPESLDLLAMTGGGQPNDLVVFNHRADRPLRLVAFAEASRTFQSARHVIVTGDRPALTLAHRLRRLRPVQAGACDVVPRRLVAGAVADLLAPVPCPFERVVFAGNTKGLDVAPIVDRIDAARRPTSERTGMERRP